MITVLARIMPGGLRWPLLTLVLALTSAVLAVPAAAAPREGWYMSDDGDPEHLDPVQVELEVRSGEIVSGRFLFGTSCDAGAAGYIYDIDAPVPISGGLFEIVEHDEGVNMSGPYSSDLRIAGAFDSVGTVTGTVHQHSDNGTGGVCESGEQPWQAYNTEGSYEACKLTGKTPQRAASGVRLRLTAGGDGSCQALTKPASVKIGQQTFQLAPRSPVRVQAGATKVLTYKLSKPLQERIAFAHKAEPPRSVLFRLRYTLNDRLSTRSGSVAVTLK